MNYPNDLITKASEVLLGQGVRILQGNRFAKTEAEHLDKLIGYMQLTGSELGVADMGCGFGEVSKAMSEILPKAHFYLVNCNEFQLGQCPAGPRFSRMLSDMCSTTIMRATVDLVMFNYSLCHVDPDLALHHAAMITRPGGRLFVYDYQRIRGDDVLSEKHLSARFMSDWEFRGNAILCGWDEIETIPVDGDDTLFRVAMADDTLYDAIFDDLQPVIWKAIR